MSFTVGLDHQKSFLKTFLSRCLCHNHTQFFLTRVTATGDRSAPHKEKNPMLSKSLVLQSNSYSLTQSPSTFVQISLFQMRRQVRWERENLSSGQKMFVLTCSRIYSHMTIRRNYLRTQDELSAPKRANILSVWGVTFPTAISKDTQGLGEICGPRISTRIQGPVSSLETNEPNLVAISLPLKLLELGNIHHIQPREDKDNCADVHIFPIMPGLLLLDWEMYHKSRCSAQMLHAHTVSRMVSLNTAFRFI